MDDPPVQVYIQTYDPPRADRTLVQAIVEVRQAHLDETLRSQKAAHADEHVRLVAVGTAPPHSPYGQGHSGLVEVRLRQ